jgi:hypothetical protein
MKQQSNKTLAAAMTLMILVFIVAIPAFMCNSESSEKPIVSKPTKQDAVAWSHVCVGKQLKNPGSAEYPWQSDESIDQINDTMFSVLSYVDNYNDFGALKRSYYKCTIVFKLDGTADCNNLVFEDIK